MKTVTIEITEETYDLISRICEYDGVTFTADNIADLTNMCIRRARSNAIKKINAHKQNTI